MHLCLPDKPGKSVTKHMGGSQQACGLLGSRKMLPGCACLTRQGLLCATIGEQCWDAVYRG